MAANNLRHALFCAVVTLIISIPILGLNLEAEGINIILTGAKTSTYIAIVLAAIAVFVFQAYRDSIMGLLGKLPNLNPLADKEPMEQSKRAKLESWILTGIIVLALFWPFVVSRGSVDLATLV